MESRGPCARRDGVAHTAARVPSCLATDLPTLLSPKASLWRSPPLACTALPAPSALERCSRGSAKKPFIFLIRQMPMTCSVNALLAHALTRLEQGVESVREPPARAYRWRKHRPQQEDQ